MNTLTIDTHATVKKLTASGFTTEQAEVQVAILADALAANMDDLATKGDVRDVRSEIELLRREMQAMELRLVIKLGTFFAVAVGILIAVLRVSH